MTQGAGAVIAKSLSDYSSMVCFWAGWACALASTYCFLIAPIEYVALAIALFGAAVGLELVAVLLIRHRASRSRNGPGASPDDGAQPPD